MFNVAVINIKDIIKYIIKAIIVIVIIAFIASLLKNKNLSNNSINVGKSFSKISFVQCLDITIPGIKQAELKPKEDTSIIQKILNIELSMANEIIILPDGSKANINQISPEDKAELNIPTNVETQVLESSVKESYTSQYKSVKIKNNTDYGLTEEMLIPNVELINSKNVLIFHTHTCESYTPTEQYNYEMTGNYRTTDLNYNVARVGTELTNFLKAKKFNVIHDITYHDFPAYSGSYTRSLETVKSILNNNTETEIVLDLHRDAIGDSNYAPTVKIGEEYAAQLMFVIGTNEGGLEHENWLQNLKMAVKIQEKANELYPGLFKPILLTSSRYNQHTAKGASIIEVGATGNTLEQCINSMKYLSQVLEKTFEN